MIFSIWQLNSNMCF